MESERKLFSGLFSSTFQLSYPFPGSQFFLFFSFLTYPFSFYFWSLYMVLLLTVSFYLCSFLSFRSFPSRRILTTVFKGQIHIPFIVSIDMKINIGQTLIDVDMPEKTC